MKHLDLFSGIGGFALAARRVGWETIGFCEPDDFCRRVLEKHWPGVPCHRDVRELAGEPYRGTVDILTGGFPCQDLSAAGKQLGIDGSRSGLWTELARLLGEIRPRFAVVENVPALLSGGDGRWFGRVLGDLAALGFDAEWHVIPASAVGAEHERGRVWVVAYPRGSGFQGLHHARWGKHLQSVAEDVRRRGRATPRVRGTPDAVPDWVDRIKSLGNSIVPHVAEAIFRSIE